MQLLQPYKSAGARFGLSMKTGTPIRRTMLQASLPAAYHTNRGNIGAGWLVKSERP
jgi:hypothetical protein